MFKSVHAAARAKEFGNINFCANLPASKACFMGGWKNALWPTLEVDSTLFEIRRLVKVIVLGKFQYVW